MISVTAHVDTNRLLEFVPFANRELRSLVDDTRKHGELYMSSIVPHGRTNRLAASVVSSIFSVTDAHHVGQVGVDERIAPYAGDVDRGTGIDGPSASPVIVNRPPRSVIGGQYGSRVGSQGSQAHHGRKTGVMVFTKNGEPPRFRRVVKATPSVKIQRGKNFSGRTQDEVYDFTRIRTGVLSVKLALFFADERFH